MRPFFSLVPWLACASIAAGQASLPAPPAASIVDISPAGGMFSEPSIAINPNNPDLVVVVYQVGAYAAYSTDSGKSYSTWMEHCVRPRGRFATGLCGEAYQFD
jgi:hypothetical protein